MAETLDQYFGAMSLEDLRAVRQHLLVLERKRRLELQTATRDARILQRLRNSLLCTVEQAAIVLACDVETIMMFCDQNEFYWLTLPDGTRRLQVSGLARSIRLRLRDATGVYV